MLSDKPKKPCDDDDCPGWAIFNNREIQRCDTCRRFEGDAEATEHGLAALEELQHAARQVIDCADLYDSGDLAKALRRLDAALKL